MKLIKDTTYKNIRVVESSKGEWAVWDIEGNEIVPFGRYDWIEGFSNGLSRVKIGKESSNNPHNNNKWGIIDASGGEVLPVIYDNVWKFMDKALTQTHIDKDGIVEYFDLDDYTISSSRYSQNSYGNYRPYREEHYEEFAGTYAQDVAGYSDEDIYDAFDGDSDAYWNID